PYGVRFLPSKSSGVEARILLGSGCVAWIACLAALFRLCFFPRLTIWVTSLGFCAAELLPPHPRFYSMFSGVTNWSTSAQPSRIRSRVHNSGDNVSNQHRAGSRRGFEPAKIRMVRRTGSGGTRLRLFSRRLPIVFLIAFLFASGTQHRHTAVSDFIKVLAEIPDDFPPSGIPHVAL